jgi:hypothetical protein
MGIVFYICVKVVIRPQSKLTGLFVTKLKTFYYGKHF